MARRPAEETVDRAHAAVRQETSLCLSVARGEHAAFAVALSPGATVSIGRDRQADLCLGSPSLSRLHFAIETGASEGASVRDLGSRNGTFVGGSAVGDSAVPLAVGAEVHAGDVRFSLLRRTSLPSSARPFLLLGGLEASLFAMTTSETAALTLAAFELARPIDERGEALEPFAQLPREARAALVSDLVVVVAVTDETHLDALRRALAQRSVTVDRHVSVRPKALDRDVVGELLRRLEAPAPVAGGDDEIPAAFRYPSLRKLHDEMRRIAPRPISILITGETGTGKEVTAREIHRLSKRSGPLVAVNTAALPEALIESELFGHERGAFSGAQTAKAGLIETADKGTLFLDEIGELPLPLQAKLLRVLEDQSVRRVGANVERKVDLRIVAATHQDLEGLAREKRFRQDLLFRLNGASFALPPLRERRGEIGPLARHLLAEITGGSPPALDPGALAALEAYDWPGNVRELKHVLERALAFADAGTILREHLPAAMLQPAPPPTAVPAAGKGADVRSSVRDYERQRILEALREAGGNRTRAAEILGLPRRTLVYKLSKLGISGE